MGSICGRCGVLALAALGVMTTTAAAGDPPQDGIMREGGMARWSMLEPLELTSFDRSLLDELRDWRIEPKPGPSDLDGKVVVVYTWSSFLSASTGPIRSLSRLVDTYGDRGLVVIGVHHPQGWEGAASIAERRRANFPIAHDATGSFRAALKVDQDPDLYVLDRAGQIRFADIESSSLNDAVERLLAETPEEAAGESTRRDRAVVERAEAAQRSAGMRSQVTLSDLPAVPFVPPPESAYENPRGGWPDLEFERRSGRRGSGDEAPVIRVSPPEGNRWFGERPSDSNGKVTLYYFFPTSRQWLAGDAGPFYDFFESYQRANTRDLNVVGVGVWESESGRTRRNSEGDEAARRGRWLADFMTGSALNHPVVDMIGDDAFGGEVFEGLPRERGARGRGSYPLPSAALVSSDGVLRWRGALDLVGQEGLRAALNRMLRVDPGVQARRDAEARFLRGEASFEDLAREAALAAPADDDEGGR